MLEYRERRAPGRLAAHVECVWAVTDAEPGAARTPERVVPDGCPELIVHLADPFARWRDGRWRRQPRCFVAGTLTRPWLLRAGPCVDTLGLRFRPGGLTALLGGTLEGATDREVPLARWLGAAGQRSLGELLLGGASVSERLLLAERWLVARLESAPPRGAGVSPAVALVREARGRLGIEELARRVGLGRRRLERLFLRHLGIGPKLYARIVRLAAVLAALDGAERVHAVDLALEAGYFDQAHLLRDFRVLVGRSPRRPRREDGELAQHFTAAARLRVLLDGG